MPNNKGGKKFKKGKKSRDFNDKKQLIKKDPEEAQVYAQVINPKGNGRFELLCCDGGKERLEPYVVRCGNAFGSIVLTSC